MRTVQSEEKSAPAGVDELSAPVTQGPETTQSLPDVPPLSPGTAQVCQEILSAAGGTNDLFPDNTSGYVPANVDGTFREMIRNTIPLRLPHHRQGSMSHKSGIFPWKQSLRQRWLTHEIPRTELRYFPSQSQTGAHMALRCQQSFGSRPSKRG